MAPAEQAGGAVDDEADFSDVSSVCADDREAFASQCWESNKSKFHAQSRVVIKERLRLAKEVERELARKGVEEMQRKEEERKERELELILAKEAEEGDTQSDPGSGMSDVSAEAAPAEVQRAAASPPEGPELETAQHDDSDHEASGPVAAKPKKLSSDFDSFGSTDSESERDQPASPTVKTTNDDCTRVRLHIQAALDGGSGTTPLRPVVVRLRGDWSPLATARFMELVEAGFYHGTRFHRVIKGTLAQFGLPVDPRTFDTWKTRLLQDEAVRQDPKGGKNSRGTLSFAAKGEHTRCCQVFINLGHHKGFDIQGFTPFAEVVAGMDVIDELFSGYGEVAPKGTGPDPDDIKERGEEYLKTFPKLSRIESAEVLSRSGDSGVGVNKRPSLAKDKEKAKESTPRNSEGEVFKSPSLSRVSFSKDTPGPAMDVLKELAPRVSSPVLSGEEIVSRRPSSPAGSGLAAAKALKTT